MPKKVRQSRVVDVALYAELRASGASPVDAATRASLDTDASESAMKSRAYSLEHDPRVQRAIANVRAPARAVARRGWKQAVKRLARVVDDPASTNLDVISAAKVLGTATGDLRERTDVTVEHRVTFRTLVEPATPDMIEARAVAGTEALASHIQARSLPAGDGATPTTPPGESVYEEVRQPLSVDPGSFSATPGGTPAPLVMAEETRMTREYAPPMSNQEVVASYGYGDAYEACQREMRELYDAYTLKDDHVALRKLRWLEGKTRYRLPERLNQ